MAHNSRIRLLWSPLSVLLSSDCTALDVGVYKSINGDDGGVWAPSARIYIGGQGLTLTSTNNHIYTGGSLTVDAGGNLTSEGSFISTGSADIDSFTCSIAGTFEGFLTVAVGAVLRVRGTATVEADASVTYQGTSGHEAWAYFGQYGRASFLTGSQLILANGSTMTAGATSTVTLSGTANLNGTVAFGGISFTTFASGSVTTFLSGSLCTFGAGSLISGTMGIGSDSGHACSVVFGTHADITLNASCPIGGDPHFVNADISIDSASTVTCAAPVTQSGTFTQTGKHLKSGVNASTDLRVHTASPMNENKLFDPSNYDVILLSFPTGSDRVWSFEPATDDVEAMVRLIPIATDGSGTKITIKNAGAANLGEFDMGVALAIAGHADFVYDADAGKWRNAGFSGDLYTPVNV